MNGSWIFLRIQFTHLGSNNHFSFRLFKFQDKITCLMSGIGIEVIRIGANCNQTKYWRFKHKFKSNNK